MGRGRTLLRKSGGECNQREGPSVDAPNGGVTLRRPPPLSLHACSPLPHLRAPRSPFSHSLLCTSPCWGMRPPITTSFCTHRPPHSPSFRASPRFARHPIFMHPHLSRLHASFTFLGGRREESIFIRPRLHAAIHRFCPSARAQAVDAHQIEGAIRAPPLCSR